MKIKTKLRLGFAFLFLMVFLLAGFSGYYLYTISASSKVILKNNYESLTYARNMRGILDRGSLPLTTNSLNGFEAPLKQQENNITERGEKDLTVTLRNHFNALKTSPGTQEATIRLIRADLARIEQVNMNAIVRKTEIAHHSVNNASMYMGAISCVIVLVLFSFSVNFPGFLINPLLELKEGIQEISKKNYKARLDFPVNDEFGPLASAFNEMAAKLNEWESSNLASIVSEKQRIETIIKRMQDGIIGIGGDNSILFINPVAEKLLNISEQSAVGKSIDGLLQSNDLLRSIFQDDAKDQTLKIFADGRESFFQLERQSISLPPAGLPFDEPLPAASSVSAGEVFILKNVTRYKELDEAKTHFIATISHELKTPISAIKMSLKLLEDERIGSLNEEQRKLVSHIANDARRLLKITGELLDLSQTESGNIQLHVEPSQPDEIVKYAVSAISTQAAEKNIAINYINQAEQAAVLADREKTTWVLVNFLSNAIRYSSEKSAIDVRVLLVENQLQFSVTDHGRGIDQKYLPRLFERYFQVPTDGRNRSGTGLGLAISKDFIEAQGGTIFVESEFGSGSTFGFRLPAGGKQSNPGGSAAPR